MANGAIHSRKTKLEIKVGSEWLPVTGMTTFSGLGGGTAATITVTDLDSDAVEKMSGLLDEGQFQANFNWNPSDEGQEELEVARLSTENRDFRLVLRSGKAYAFTGAVKSCDKSGGVDAALALAVTIEISGLVTKTTVAP